MLLDGTEVFVRKFQGLEHGKLGIIGPQVLFLVGRHAGALRHYLLCLPGLELDGIGPRLLGCVTQLQGTGKASIVVHAGFGNDENLSICT